MRNKHPLMKLSPEEMHFLRHWMYDEMHYQEGSGPAKQLQREHNAISANLAVIIAAALPDLAEQWAAGVGPPPRAIRVQSKNGIRQLSSVRSQVRYDFCLIVERHDEHLIFVCALIDHVHC